MLNHFLHLLLFNVFNYKLVGRLTNLIRLKNYYVKLNKRIYVHPITHNIDDEVKVNGIFSLIK
jgi:hypothetical protein